MRRAFLAALISAIVAQSADAGPRFRDLSQTLPVPHIYGGDWEHFVGGGVAVFDCNADGFPDVFAAGGENPARLFVNTAKVPGETINFTLAEAPAKDLTGVIGAYPLDIDGDGHLDLFVLRVGENRVLRGEGDCSFSRVDDTWGIAPGNDWSTAFAAIWEPGAEWPTFAVGNYVDRERPDGPFGACDIHQLFRPSEGSYRPPEIIAPGYCALSMLFVDWSGTGASDLWISNDRHYYVHEGQEQLFRISPALKEFGADDGWPEHKLWGMGIAARDITGDGRPEIAVTSMADQKLFTLKDPAHRPAFSSIAYERGTTAHVPHIGDEGRPSAGWHVAFGDVDNDGLDDLYFAKGNVNQMPSLAMRDPDNLLMQGADGRFTEAAADAGVASMERGRGAALVDLNRDGLLDLVVVQRRAPMAVYQNETSQPGHWLAVRLLQDSGNRNAVGARIELVAGGRSQTREVHVGGGHAGGHAGFEHFGLGDAAEGRLRVIWPDGDVSPWSDVSANHHLVITRNSESLSISRDEALRAANGNGKTGQKN
ncbi:MAG: CRTAC1 family protein [Pseudomonadota bacterium]